MERIEYNRESRNTGNSIETIQPNFRSSPKSKKSPKSDDGGTKSHGGIADYDGNTFVAFVDISGLKKMMGDGEEGAKDALYALGCSNIQSIHCKSSTPPTVITIFSKTSPFEGINSSTCILYVPTGSKAAYQTAVYWDTFVNIIEE
ncbi:MAG: hypothetical protein LBR18_08770 [Tannerella sp.]|jgi:hypothetical protein|nr:hypothetical protein [Tannerella sp.]